MQQLTPDVQETIAKWAYYTINSWRLKIRELRIRSSGDFERSFTSHIMVAAGGDLEKVKFMFKFYGVFVDMGVGKGTKIGDVAENKLSRRLQGKQAGNRRRRKPWQNKVTAYNTHRLAEILQEQYGIKARVAIASNLPRVIGK